MLRNIRKASTGTRVRKSSPTRSQVHVNTPLTMMSVAFLQSEQNFVGHRAFGFVPVQKASDLYYKFSKDAFLRDEAKPRAPATESAGGGFELSTASYACTVEAFHKDVADQDRDNADSVLSLDRAATEYVTQVMSLRREKRWVSSFFTSGVWATDVTPANLWSAANGTPLADVLAGKTALFKASGGKEANVLVIGRAVFDALQTNAEIKDRFKYTTSQSITLGMLAAYFGVEEVLVANGLQATNAEGQTATIDLIAGKHALLAYRNRNPQLMSVSAGYTMSWNQYAGSQMGATITKFRMQHLRADRVEGEFAYDMKVVCPECGYFFNNVVA